MFGPINPVRVLSIFLVLAGSLLALSGSVGLLFWLMGYYRRPHALNRPQTSARSKRLIFGAARRERLRQRHAALRKGQPLRYQRRS